MILSLADNGVNGYIVKNLDKNGLVYEDNRIQVEDLIVALNGNSLRHTTKEQVIGILHQCEQSSSNDLTYVSISSLFFFGYNSIQISIQNCFLFLLFCSSPLK